MASLSAGSHLGPYEIGDALGAGGMGEVYRARDTRLGRTVAIKVITGDLANRPELRERFDREARTISGLNHPNICTLYDVGHSDEVDYLVMEYLEGETLASRLERGPLSFGEALRIAIDIGGALDTAHRDGVVHRDLKRANVMLTKNGAKLLDFGLAELGLPEKPVPISVTAMPTGGKSLTMAGSVLGTLQYMSPEQLEGKEADARSDLFAFGATMYEMLTGRKAFQGKSQVSLMAAILEHDPPAITSVQPILPAAFDGIVQGCFAKDPDERWQAARDIVKQLKWVRDHPVESPASTQGRTDVGRRGRLVWTTVTIVGLAITTGALAFRMALRKDLPASVVRFEVQPPPGERFPGANGVPRFAVSPDGNFVVFASTLPGKSDQLWIRRLDSLVAKPIPGTESASLAGEAVQQAFWSPDSRYIGFFDGVQAKLKKIDIQGGPVQALADIPPANYGGTWNADGTILVATAATSGVQRVPAGGGVPRQVTTLDKARQETGHLWPYFLPDGRHSLYHAQSAQRDRSAIYVASLDSTERKMLVESEYMAQFAAPNLLLYMRGSTLVARTLDPGTLTLSGDPVPLAESVLSAQNGRAGFSVSRGALVVASGEGGPSGGSQQWWWIDRAGKRSGPVGPVAAAPLASAGLKLSPDARRVAFSDGAQPDLWVYDLEHDVRTRLTADPDTDRDPVWSPDGSRIVFASNRRGSRLALYEKPANSAVAERVLFEAEPGSEALPLDWSSDGTEIVFRKISQGFVGHADLWVLPLSGDRKPFPYLTTPFNETQAALSSNGRWLAYVSNEAGMFQVFVQPFPDPASGKWQISSKGGVYPRWRRDGRELYYLDEAGRLIAVSVTTEPRFEVGRSTPIFDSSLNWSIYPFGSNYPYAAAPDGQRFLISVPLAGASSVPLTVTLNWTSALKH